MVAPTQFVLDGDHILLHLARPNPVFECLEANPRCLLSVAGDWAYIPGAWKAVGDEDPRRGVPTTYYAAVQLGCTARIVDESEAIAGILERQLESVEPDGDLIDPIDHGAMLKTIRGLVLSIDDVRAKFKYGGNVDQVHRDHIAGLLEQRSGPGDRAVLRHLRS